MSQVIAPNGRFSALMFQSAKELGRTSHLEEPQNRKNLNGLETEMTIKIDHIVSYLKELEENLLKAKKELFKESLLEGRENSKICAVQGKIIRNKDKYYNNLEQNVDVLSQTFQDSLDKISREFKKLQNISKQKAVAQPFGNQKNVFYIEENDVHTHNISPPQTAEKEVKTSLPKFSILKENKINTGSVMPLTTFKFSRDHVQKIPKVISSQNIENLNANIEIKIDALNQNSSKSMIQKIKNYEEPLRCSQLDSTLKLNEKLNIAPLCGELRKSEFSNDEENKSTSSGGFSDTNEDIFENEVTSSKSRRMSSYFDDEPTFLSIRSPKQLKF